jgi:hypothetical protein
MWSGIERIWHWGRYWLLSDPEFDEAVMLDEQLQRVAGSSGGGLMYWYNERKPDLLIPRKTP